MNDDDGLSPALIQAILNTGGYDAQKEDLTRRQAIADRLRTQSMTPAPTQSVGGRVLPNWGQALGNIVNAYTANKMQPGINTGMEQVQARNVDARKQYFDALIGALRRRAARGMAPQPQVSQPPAAIDPSGSGEVIGYPGIPGDY